MVYFSDSSVETLTQKLYTGGSALETDPLSDNVKSLMNQIEEFQYNAGAAWYDDKNNNYYYSFDTTNDNDNEPAMVHNSTCDHNDCDNSDCMDHNEG